MDDYDDSNNDHANKKELCRRFLADPSKNPITGRPLKVGQGPWVSYAALCHEYELIVDTDELLDRIPNLQAPKNKQHGVRQRNPERETQSLNAPRTTSPRRYQRRNMEEEATQIVIPRNSEPFTITSGYPRVQRERDEDFSAPSQEETIYPRVTGPSSTVSETVERYGRETFRPDAQTEVFEEPPTRTRARVRGPYGPGGTETEVDGVYTSPGRRHYVTKAIPEHEIESEFPGTGGPLRRTVTNLPGQTIINAVTPTGTKQVVSSATSTSVITRTNGTTNPVPIS